MSKLRTPNNSFGTTFTQVPDPLMASIQLNFLQKVLIAYVMRWQSTGNKCTVGNKGLSLRFGVSDSTIKRTITSLNKLSFFESKETSKFTEHGTWKNSKEMTVDIKKLQSFLSTVPAIIEDEITLCEGEAASPLITNTELSTPVTATPPNTEAVFDFKTSQLIAIDNGDFFSNSSSDDPQQPETSPNPDVYGTSNEHVIADAPESEPTHQTIADGAGMRIPDEAVHCYYSELVKPMLKFEKFKNCTPLDFYNYLAQITSSNTELSDSINPDDKRYLDSRGLAWVQTNLETLRSH